MDEETKRTLARCVAVLAAHIRKRLLSDLGTYPLCDFFLRRCVESMSWNQIQEDLGGYADLSLVAHFDKPDEMRRLEEFFANTMKTFGVSKEGLKAKAEFNFDVHNPIGFESVRAVFRIANSLSEAGFTQFAFLQGEGLADLTAMRDGQRWFIEVKTLVLQTKPREFRSIYGTTDILPVDKFQPDTNSVEDYVERVSRQIAGNLIGKARQQLIDTVEKQGEGKKMIGLVVNLFAAGFFMDTGNMEALYKRLLGKCEGWEKNYLVDVDALAFLTGELYLFNSA